jgi:3-methyladenine DNA glycosylase/8-oxoguanine DNA glycosylase
VRPVKEEIQALARRDPALGRAMESLPPFPDFPLPPRRSYFHTLARIIIHQQLATAAARTIHDRVKKLSPRSGRFPTSAELLALPEEELRGAGLSRSKLRALRDLAGKVEAGELKLRSLATRTDLEVTRSLTAVWGLGEWSAQMFLLFRLGRPDVFAPGDLGLREGIRILDGLDARPTPGAALDRARVWAPLRSVASWYLWRLADGGGI